MEEEDQSDLKPYITCPGCGQDLKVPIILPCLHNFCMECLRREHELQRQEQEERRQEEAQVDRNRDVINEPDKQLNLSSNEGDRNEHRNSNESIEVGRRTVMLTINEDPLPASNITDSNFFCCPLCRSVMTNVALDDMDDLGNLIINAPLQNIERTISLKKDLPQGLVKCDCGNVAVGVCYNKNCSNRPFCGDCLKYHLRDKKMHAIAFPDDGESESSGDSGQSIGGSHGHEKMSWKDLKQSDILCEEEDHGYCKNLYCVDHDEVICRACTWVNSSHRGCNRIERTQDVYDDWIRVTNEKLDVVEEINSHFKAAIITMQEMKRALADKVKMVTESINNTCKNLKQKLENQKDELLSQCDVLLNHKTHELDQHLELLNRVSATFKRHIDTVDWLKNMTIKSEFMILKTQINQRSDELVSTYSNYQCDPIEDDCIFFEENTTFNISNAIGQVYSTPSVKNFTLSPLTSPVAHQPSYFAVVTHDALSNKIISHNLPELCATIRHVNEDRIETGFVKKDRKSGQYHIAVIPSRSGQHELCVYQPLRRPFDRCYVGGKRYTIFINEETLMPYLFPR